MERKREKAQYLSWICLFCIVLALFAIGIMVVGFQQLSFGKGATVAVLVVAAIATGYGSFRLKDR